MNGIAAWFHNFVQHLKIHFQELGLTQADIDELEAEKEFMQAVHAWTAFLNEHEKTYLALRNDAWLGCAKEAVEKIDMAPQPTLPTGMPAAVRPGILVRLKKMILLLRVHPNMTPALASLLGILPFPKGAVNDRTSFVPALTGQIIQGRPVLDCLLYEYAGYELARSIGNLDQFTVFDKSVGKPITDTAPLPPNVSAEVRNYRARMLNSFNQPIGPWSNIVSLTVSRG